jgi:hypothetical protein
MSPKCLVSVIYGRNGVYLAKTTVHGDEELDEQLIRAIEYLIETGALTQAPYDVGQDDRRAFQLDNMLDREPPTMVDDVSDVCVLLAEMLERELNAAAF